MGRGGECVPEALDDVGKDRSEGNPQVFTEGAAAPQTMKTEPGQKLGANPGDSGLGQLFSHGPA